MGEFLHSIHIENYRCLRDVTIELGPLTALVGPNAAGKSAVVAAIDPNSGFRLTDRWRHESLQIKIDYAWPNGRSGQRVLSVHGGAGSSLPEFGCQTLRLELNALRQFVQLAHSRQLEASGHGIPNVLETLTRVEKAELADHLRRLVPIYSDVDARPHPRLAPGYHELAFQDRWQKDLWFTPDEVSDGTLLVLAFLVLQYQHEAIDLVAIEEPEHGIHPYLIENLVAILRALATGKLGPRPIQILITTHSPTLLNFLEPTEVRFLKRDPSDGSTRVEVAPIDSAQWGTAFAAYEQELGGMWLSGVLGGVPGG